MRGMEDVGLVRRGGHRSADPVDMMKGIFLAKIIKHRVCIRTLGRIWRV